MSIDTLVQAMNPDQRKALAALLMQETDLVATDQTAVPEAPVAAEAVTPNTYYNLDEAVAVTFKADLSVNPKSRDISYAEQFDHVWCKGNYRVKGPKGGVYFVGRCVLGVKKGQQIKGTLRVGNKYFEAFLDGQPLDAWFRPEGETESVLIGTLTKYRNV